MFSRPNPKGQNGPEKGFATTSPAPSNTLSPLPLGSASGSSFLGSERIFAEKISGDYPTLSYVDAAPAVGGYESMTSPATSNERGPDDDVLDNVAAMPPTPVTSTVKDSSGNMKRKYSRNGCTECKRRRIKCDETKPTCWQCARLNRECIYVLNLRNKKRKNKEMAARQRPAEKLTATKPPISTPTEKDQLDDVHLLELPNVIPVGNMDGYDANLLIQNLNDIVSMKLNDSLLDNQDLKDLVLPTLDLPELMPQSASAQSSSVPISFLMNSVITFNTELSSFKLGGVHDDYLKVFFVECLGTIAPFFQNQGNPLRDIILSFARNEPYLLSATLAVGASLAQRKSNSFDDERNYCAYLSHCLSLLGEQFQNESNVLNKIEPITLTVIMLAWDCINTMNSQWRSHLKGVTDLFKKINSGNSSKVMNVAKCWFKVMETFASISTVLGGSVTDEQDLDLIFDPYDYQYVDSLKFLNIMTPLNKFNLLRGHKEDFDLVIKEVIKALTSIRKSEKFHLKKEGDVFSNLDYLLWSPQTDANKSAGPLCYFTTQKILVEIDRQLDYQFIDKSGIIPPESQSHPKNNDIIDNAIDMVTLRNGKTIAISWYDISHQTQVLSFLLIVLLKFLSLPKESITVQQVVKKILSFFKFLESDSPPQNSRTCYSNFAVLIAGLNAMDEETRNIVRNYYKLNGGKFQRLTEHNLNRLEKVWYGKGSEYRMADQDVLTW